MKLVKSATYFKKKHTIFIQNSYFQPKIKIIDINNQTNNIVSPTNLTVFFLSFSEYLQSKQDQHPSSMWYFLYYNYYMQLFFKTPIVFKNLNMKYLIPHHLLTYMMLSSQSIRWKKFYIKYSNELLEILYLSLWLKNLNLFAKWLKKYFEKIDLKKHRKLFIFLSFLLGHFIWQYNIFFSLKGLRLTLRGKFGKAGSVRKVRKYIKKGKCSYSSKNLALVHRSFVIRTITGVFGIKLEIFF